MTASDIAGGSAELACICQVPDVTDVTPQLSKLLLVQGTILPGVTRKSVIQLLQLKGYTVEETNVPVSEAMEADELFTTGTAVVVCAVGSLTYKVWASTHVSAGLAIVPWERG